jgi:uncharacterized repeat protein (TIGR03803 family)
MELPFKVDVRFLSYGTVFAITPGGTLTTLLTFNTYNGAYPEGTLIQAVNGDLYGTANSPSVPTSTARSFKVTPVVQLATFYSFNVPTEIYPQAGLVRGSDGRFYRTTYGVGSHYPGNLFALNADGQLTTLHAFCSQSNCADGQHPTAPEGGANGLGTIFQITPGGAFTVLHSFAGSDGAPLPMAGCCKPQMVTFTEPPTLAARSPAAMVPYSVSPPAWAPS